MYENCISMVKVVHAKQKMQRKEVTPKLVIKFCRQIPYQKMQFKEVTSTIYNKILHTNPKLISFYSPKILGNDNFNIFVSCRSINFKHF